MDSDFEKLTQHFQDMQTDDLLRVLHIDTEEYLPEGKEFAVRELQKRGIDGYAPSAIEEAARLKLRIAKNLKRILDEKASKLLSRNEKIFYTLLPGWGVWVNVLTPQEFVQRKKDLDRCVLTSFLVIFFVFIFASLYHRIFPGR